jgi:Leucine-rich repeat (LRR) protein
MDDDGTAWSASSSQDDWLHEDDWDHDWLHDEHATSSSSSAEGAAMDDDAQLPDDNDPPPKPKPAPRPRLPSFTDVDINGNQYEVIYLNGCVTITDIPFDSIPEMLFDPKVLPGLTELHMNGTHMVTLHSSILVLTALTKLDLSDNDDLESLTPDIGEMVGLKHLNLSSTVLEELPSSIGQLTRLETLDLSGCPCPQVPSSIGKLTGLERLRLGGCDQLERLPVSIGQLTRLEILVLSRCPCLQDLPSSIGQLTRLQTLDLRGCYSSITAAFKLPEEIGRMAGLRLLILDSCPLKEVPSSIGNLTGLERLLLCGCNQLERLPASIGQLTRLEFLDLSQCIMFEGLPKEIGCMVGLTKLNLLELGCPIKEVPLPSSIWKLTGLKELSLNWPGGPGLTPVSTWTEELGGMVGLRVLTLLAVAGQNELPSSIGKLTGLEKLDLKFCTIGARAPALLLPEEIGEMQGLRKICILRSAAKELPSSIGKLTGLEKLSLRGCHNIEALPQEIGSMVGLMVLNLAGCRRLGDAGASIITGMIRTNQCIKRLCLCDCGIQEDGILAIGRAIQETPRLPSQFFNIEGIQLNGVAAKLGLPVESCNADDWSNFRIIAWMFRHFTICDKVIAFLTAEISAVVEEYRPRPLDGSGNLNSVIPAVSALSQDTMKQIGKMFMNMQTQERLQPMHYATDSES